MLDAVSAIDAPFHGSGSFFLRVSALGLVALVAFGVLALRLWSLQVLQGRHYEASAVRQSYRVVRLPAARGAILDAQGRTLASTEGRLTLTADPQSLGEVVGGQWVPTPSGRRALARVARLSGQTVAAFVQRFRAGLFKDPYAPVEIIPRLSRPLGFALEERAEEFPGFAVAVVPTRSYPQGALGSEFLGLLGEIDPTQLRSPRYRWAKPGVVIGQSGVEATYDRILNGGLANGRIRVDSLGRPVGRLTLSPAPAPRSLQLTVDTRIQRVAEQAIKDGIALAHQNGHGDASAGAAVVLDPNTGGIVALASYPDFSQVAAARDPSYLAALYRSGGALLDRATQGIYPAGSTFKPVVAAAALADGVIGPDSVLPCTGSLTVGGVVFHNVEAGIDASLTLPQAIGISCDTWFYRVGLMLYQRLQQGDLALQRTARQLGFGQPTGLDLPGESGGVVPTPAWLRTSFTNPWDRIWYAGTSVNLAIGQGYLAVTPLQLAVAYAALANGGAVVRPHVAQAIVDPGGHVVRELRFPPVRRVRLVGLQTIRDGIYAAANSPGGTSFAVFGGFHPTVMGKTGTAEAPPGSDHSWYASWAPAGHPRYVVVVLIEHGGFGAQAAAPAAKEIYQALFRTTG